MINALKSKKYLKQLILFLMVLTSSAVQVSCASGGYKFTRKFSQFVNSKNIVLRIILYIVTIPVFGITLAVDTIIFNTLDFWDGKVSANEYSFSEDGKEYVVKHSIENNLKRTNINVFEDNKLIASHALVETKDNKIQVFNNNDLKYEVENLNGLALLSTFENGKLKNKDLFNKYLGNSKSVASK